MHSPLDTDFYYDQATKFCFKKCIRDAKALVYNAQQESCLDRCAFKFKEAVLFGTETLKYLDHQVSQANSL